MKGAELNFIFFRSRYLFFSIKHFDKKNPLLWAIKTNGSLNQTYLDSRNNMQFICFDLHEKQKEKKTQKTKQPQKHDSCVYIVQIHWIFTYMLQIKKNDQAGLVITSFRLGHSRLELATCMIHTCRYM